MSIEDQPTQQIRRTPPPAPIPGSLNPVGDQSPQPPVDGSTEVLSLDDLFGAPQAATTETPVTQTPVAETQAPVVVTPTPVAPPPPAAPRIGAVPVGKDQRPSGGHAGRVLGDAATAWRGGLDRSRAWLTTGDNTVIAATAVIALLLLLAVALF